MISGACTRHAYKPLFENLPAWRRRGGKFRVFSAFFGENRRNRRRSPSNCAESGRASVRAVSASPGRGESCLTFGSVERLGLTGSRGGSIRSRGGFHPARSPGSAPLAPPSPARSSLTSFRLGVRSSLTSCGGGCDAPARPASSVRSSLTYARLRHAAGPGGPPAGAGCAGASPWYAQDVRERSPERRRCCGSVVVGRAGRAGAFPGEAPVLRERRGWACRTCGSVPRGGAGRAGASWLGVPDVREGRFGWGFKCGRTPTWWWGSSTVNDVPAVTYSPTPSRVQYHRRCGS